MKKRPDAGKSAPRTPDDSAPDLPQSEKQDGATAELRFDPQMRTAQFMARHFDAMMDLTRRKFALDREVTKRKNQVISGGLGFQRLFQEVIEAAPEHFLTLDRVSDVPQDTLREVADARAPILGLESDAVVAIAKAMGLSYSEFEQLARRDSRELSAVEVEDAMAAIRRRWVALDHLTDVDPQG